MIKLGIDYNISGKCECCNQYYNNVVSWTPRLTYNHIHRYYEVYPEANKGLKESKTLKELLDILIKICKFFPSTDRNFSEGDYYKDTHKNASIGINSLLVWTYINHKKFPNAKVSIWY